MENNEIMVNEQVIETAAEEAVKSGIGFGKAALIVGGIAALGYGIIKTVKHIKAKKAEQTHAEAEMPEADFEEVSED